MGLMTLPYIISKLSLKEKTPSLNLMFSPFILFRPALESGLLCALACFPSAFLAVRCLQPDRQSGLVQHIDYAALGEGFFQAAKVEVAFR